MAEKLKESGYYNEEIEEARKKALNINRNEILHPVKQRNELKTKMKNELIFVTNRDVFINKQIKNIIFENQESINHLLGQQTKIIIGERRNAVIPLRYYLPKHRSQMKKFL